MSVPPLAAGRRVLIIDDWSESRRLLGSILERGGAEVFEARQPSRAMALLDRHRPDLIVYDVGDRDTERERSDLADAADRISAPIVVVGTAKRNATPLRTDRFVTKPYHYAALLRRIKSVLDS